MRTCAGAIAVGRWRRRCRQLQHFHHTPLDALWCDTCSNANQVKAFL